MSSHLRTMERRILRAKGLLPSKRKVKRAAYKPWTKAVLKMLQAFKQKQKAVQEQKKDSVKEQLERERSDEA